MNDKKRLVAIAVGLSVLFCFVLVRFYQIQIVQHERWQNYALAQHQHIVTEPFSRGSFFSNTAVKQGHPEESLPFVVDVQKYHLYVDPESIPAEPQANSCFATGVLAFNSCRRAAGIQFRVLSQKPQPKVGHVAQPGTKRNHRAQVERSHPSKPNFRKTPSSSPQNTNGRTRSARCLAPFSTLCKKKKIPKRDKLFRPVGLRCCIKNSSRENRANGW
jgi:cell division protein FtsI/penicillin-binding protein 2